MIAHRGSSVKIDADADVETTLKAVFPIWRKNYQVTEVAEGGFILYCAA